VCARFSHSHRRYTVEKKPGVVCDTTDSGPTRNLLIYNVLCDGICKDMVTIFRTKQMNKS